MSYSPTTWSTNNVISSINLNKLEQGVANINNLVLTETITEASEGTYHTLNASPYLIKEALSKGKKIYVLTGNKCFFAILNYYDEGENYQIYNPNNNGLYYEASNFYSPFYYIIAATPEPV